MANEREAPERGPRRRPSGEGKVAPADSRHSIQESGHQAADPAAYAERSDDAGAPRRRPGPIKKGA